MHTKKLLALLASGLLVVTAAEAREGFGFSKKAALMNRTKPPALNLAARRIVVETASDRSKESEDAKALKRLIEEMILNGRGSLAAGEKPEMTIVVALDRLVAHETWETKTESEYKKIGEKQVWDDKKKKYKSEDVYGNVNVQKTVKVLDASLTGTFDIEDKKGKIIDSGNLSETIKEKFEEGKSAPSPAKVEETLMQRAATAVASRIVPTTDRVSVLLPRGSFESLVPLAEMNAWDRYLAGVEATAPKSDKKQEAFRQYALGVAKEGLGYASDDRGRALELLSAAVKHYETAAISNPGEKLFAQSYTSILSTGTSAAPLSRASASLTAFEAWTAGGGKKTSTSPAAVAKGKNSLDNTRLIEMAKAGLTDENLILAIDAADTAEFDTTPDGLIALARGGVSRSVIAHMQKRKK